MPAGDAPDTLRAVQTVRTSTFIAPPLDGSLLFPEWLDWHLEKNPEHSLCILVGEGKEEDVTITWGEAARAAYRLTAKLREDVKPSAESDGSGIRIGILTNTDNLTYATLVLAILRAGFVPFPISTRNSVPALEHLIKKTNCRYIFGSVPSKDSPPTALQDTTATLLVNITDLTLLEVPKSAAVYPRLASTPVKPYNAVEDKKITPSLPSVRSFPEFKATKDAPTLLLHSSGSTSFPKPIPLSHANWTGVLRCTTEGDVDLCGTRWAVMGLPVFHGMGIILTLGSPAASGAIALLFRPRDPPAIPTPERILASAERGRADFLMTVPIFCVDWSHNPEAVRYLASLKAVIYGGGPLPQEVGDRLTENGVRLVNGYGATEVGLIFTMSLAEERGKDWVYGQFPPRMRRQMVPEGNGLYRLVVIDCEECPIAVSNRDDMKAFDTNDLLEQHPTRKDLWKLMGRADDQIMMSNGEKTNPGPLEAMINGNPKVQASVMFGRAKAQVGIAIEPAESVTITNDAELAAFRNLIWPDIEKANAFAPQHSRIFKELILVIDPKKKPFAKTPKGTIARNAVLRDFAEEIEAVYAAAEQPTRAEWAEPPSAWDEAALHDFVVRVVNGVLRGDSKKGHPVDEARDLFEQGCDSLQATYIRAAITSALRSAPKPEGKSDIAATSVPQNLVFSYSTVKRLVAYMNKAISAVAGGHSRMEADQTTTVEDMLAMVHKYTQDFPIHEPGIRSSTGEVVLLTGSTGTLGTYLLQQLLLDERVERIYAVNRSSAKHDLVARQRDAFEDRGADVKLLESPKLRLLETDVAAENIGLSDDVLREIRNSLTAIVHNAWRLDFNLSLSAFESGIRATRNLVDLALTSRGPSAAQVIFTSSVGTVMNWREPRAVPEEPIADPAVAAGTGYSESKWVAERVMVAAAEQRRLNTTIWRVGQLAGSTQNGAWNTTDWLPLIVKSGKVLNALPTLPGCISWLPTDKAAQSIIDVLHAESPTTSDTAYRYLHLVHPNPVPWDNIFNLIAERLSLPLMPYQDWLSRLEGDSQDISAVERNPAIKLLEFFRGGYNALEQNSQEGKYKPREAMGMADLQTSKAVEVSETLRGLKVLGEEDVKLWLGYWEQHGMFT